MSVKKSCAFFGHRTLESDLMRHLEKAINTMIQEYRITTFWCGGYGAFDKKQRGQFIKLERNSWESNWYWYVHICRNRAKNYRIFMMVLFIRKDWKKYQNVSQLVEGINGWRKTAILRLRMSIMRMEGPIQQQACWRKDR